MKNYLQVIGFISNKLCFLNVSKEEALKRYKETFDNYNDYNLDDVTTIHFEDSFQVYDIWEN